MFYTSLKKLSKSKLYEYCYENLPCNLKSYFPWCEKKYVVMKYFSKEELLSTAQSIYSNLYL